MLNSVAEEHEQPSYCAETSGQVRAGGRDTWTSFRADGDDVRERTSWHTDEHGQPGECADWSGMYKQAEEMYRQALVLRKTALGKEHPYKLTSMNNPPLCWVVGVSTNWWKKR